MCSDFDEKMSPMPKIPYFHSAHVYHNQVIAITKINIRQTKIQILRIQKAQKQKNYMQ